MRSIVLPALLLWAAACGSKAPTQPTTETPGPPILLTITPATSLLKVGDSERFSAFAVFPNGLSRTVAAQWSVDMAGVAAVQETGVVTAVSPGVATVTATFEGRTASRSVRVVPDFDGTWQGEVRVLRCVDGDPGVCTSTPCPRGTCPPAFPVGRLVELLAILSHRDENVTGFTRAESPVIPLKGVIDVSGTLALEGVLEDRDSLGSYEYRVIEWKTTIDAPTGSMRGTFVHLRPSFSNNRATPPARISYEIVDLRRTGPAFRPDAGNAQRSSRAAVPSSP